MLQLRELILSGELAGYKKVVRDPISIGAQCVWLDAMAKRSCLTFVLALNRRSTSSRIVRLARHRESRQGDRVRRGTSGGCGGGPAG